MLLLELGLGSGVAEPDGTEDGLTEPGVELLGFGVAEPVGEEEVWEALGDELGVALFADITMVTAEAEATMPALPMPISTLASNCIQTPP